jgi:hypothetical protein
MTEPAAEAVPSSASAAPSLAQGAPDAGLEAAESRLRRLRGAARAILIGSALAGLLTALIAGLVGLGVVDYFLRSPGWLRGGLLGAAVALLLWGVLTRLVPAWRFRPSLTEVALRIERSEQGVAAGLPGVLASGLELGSTPVPAAAYLRDRAAQGLSRVRVWSLLRPRGLVVACVGLVLVAAGTAGLFAAAPGLGAIGAERVLMPWTQVEWPKRTDVEDATGVAVHPLGSGLPIRAALVGSERGAGSTRVEAEYRLIDQAGNAGPTRRVVLTGQDRKVALPPTDPMSDAPPVSGTLFERLIEPAALVEAEPVGRAASAGPGAEPGFFEYTLSTEDDTTPPRRITLVRPPAVAAVTVDIVPPAYLEGTDLGTARTVEMGAGTDERAALGGALIGSTAQVTVKLNKAVPIAPAEGAARLAWATATLGQPVAELLGSGAATLEPGPVSASGATDRFRLTMVLEAPLRLVVRPTDQHGIRADAEAVFAIDARADRPPEATVTRPGEDIEVLPTAVVESVSEGRDDVGLARVVAEYRVAQPAKGSQGAAAEAEGAFTAFGSAEPVPPEGGWSAKVVPAKALSVATRIELSKLTPAPGPGDEVWLTALATDIYARDGAGHEPVRSAVRRLRVISEEQFVEQVWNELSSIRRSAIGLAEQQATAREAVRSSRDTAATPRDQNAVAEGAARQQQAMERLRQRAEQNRLGDEGVNELLEDARNLLDEARKNAAEASRSLRQAGEAKANQDEAGNQRERAEAEREQEAAQRAFESVAEALDRGQDAWSIKRGLERLRDDQRALREETARTARETAGTNPEDLTPAQRDRAEQQARRQDDLARRAEEAVRKLGERAEQLREENPTTSAALEEAAQRAQRERLEEQMQQAAREMRQNRQQNAGQQQQRAEQTLDQMLDEMQNASRNRDEVLARELASIVEAIDALIRRQEAEVAALTNAMDAGNLGGRDQQQIRIRTATLAVLEKARAAGREARPVADALDGAAASQAEAVTALRENPPVPAAAVVAEQAALAKLREARAAADKARQAAQDRANQQKRAQLKRLYRELLDEQRRVAEQTGAVAGLDGARRQRAAARELAPAQEAVRTKAADAAKVTEEIEQAEMLRYAHDRIDEAAASAAGRLSEGEFGAKVAARQQTVLRVLQSLLDAIDESGKDDGDEFREQPDGEQQQQQGGQPGKQTVIPSAAELKLLRQMQAEALALTRLADESDDAEAKQEAAAEAGALQDALAVRAAELMKKLMEQQGGGGGSAPRVEPAGPGNDRRQGPGSERP